MKLFWKKTIVFSVIIVLAIPLLFLIAENYQKATTKFKSGALLEKFNLSRVKQKIENVDFEQLKESREELEQRLRALQEMTEQATTSINQ